jgi:hypothetical protein
MTLLRRRFLYYLIHTRAAAKLPSQGQPDGHIYRCYGPSSIQNCVSLFEFVVFWGVTMYKSSNENPRIKSGGGSRYIVTNLYHRG